jgi:cytochrome c-type biogenesis protein CcsB
VTLNLDVLSVAAVVTALVLFALTIVAFAAEWSFTAGAEVATAEPVAVPVGAGSVGAGSVGAGSVGAGSVGAESVGGGTTTALLERPAGGAGGSGGDRGPLRARQAGAVGMNLTTLGAVVLGVGVVLRGLAAHRVPWGNLYEFSITGSFVVVGTWLIANRRYPLRFLAIWIVGFATTCLGAARLFFYENVGPLRPQLNSVWLVIHVSCAVLATGAFTVAAVITVMYLFKAHAEIEGRTTGYLSRLPPSATLDRMAYRLHAFAFPIWTATIIFGAIWAQFAYGQFWEWDPKETWSLISWVAYAAYLHARATAGWRGRLAATIALVAFATILFNLTIVNFYLKGKHSYAG